MYAAFALGGARPLALGQESSLDGPTPALAAPRGARGEPAEHVGVDLGLVAADRREDDREADGLHLTEEAELAARWQVGDVSPRRDVRIPQVLTSSAADSECRERGRGAPSRGRTTSPVGETE